MSVVVRFITDKNNSGIGNQDSQIAKFVIDTFNQIIKE